HVLPRRRIAVVPAPMLVELVRDESQPAYIYHRRPAGGQLGDLKGLKQEFTNIPVSLAGEASHIDVPVGSDVRLTARSDKELVKVSILPRKGKGKEDEKEKPEQWPAPALDADKHTFRCAFTNLSGARDFDFEFTDTDNVVGRRHMLIRSNEDIGPDVNVEVGVVRRTGQGFMITPIARIP